MKQMELTILSRRLHWPNRSWSRESVIASKPRDGGLVI